LESLVNKADWRDMKTLATLEETFSGRRVLVTGHTGFKGSWLVHWLGRLGAEVSGFALDPDPGQAPLFAIVRGGAAMVRDDRVDLLDFSSVTAFVAQARPEFVFHLAAQSLVRRSYVKPVETLAVNVLGTGHLLEAVRLHAPDATVVVVTSDKCYENREWVYSYREVDPLGGHDVYSASKAAAELMTNAWRKSFFSRDGNIGRVATGRGGNVIGGGDFAEDRLVPDLVRALRKGAALPVRAPLATRPWQHVLDCLSGYLFLARWLAGSEDALTNPVRAFNFGPPGESERTVEALVNECLLHWPGHWDVHSSSGAQHEAGRLAVSIDLAQTTLDWAPRWNFPRAVAETMAWYRPQSDGATDEELRALMNRQIDAFTLKDHVSFRPLF
jgi:CDP-glucose 4,6-dehydratase